MPNMMADLPNIGRTVFNAADWLTATTRMLCSNVAKTQNPFKFAGVPKLANGSQLLVGRSSPYSEDTWGEILQFNKFFSDCRYVP